MHDDVVAKEVDQHGLRRRFQLSRIDFGVDHGPIEDGIERVGFSARELRPERLGRPSGLSQLRLRVC